MPVLGCASESDSLVALARGHIAWSFARTYCQTLRFVPGPFSYGIHFVHLLFRACSECALTMRTARRAHNQSKNFNFCISSTIGYSGLGLTSYSLVIAVLGVAGLRGIRRKMSRSRAIKDASSNALCLVTLVASWSQLPLSHPASSLLCIQLLPGSMVQSVIWLLCR
jgi:hypothetical protein